MVQHVMVARITRVDAQRRIVEAIATSEAVDSFNTRFSYEASCDAFARAFGNVREMHHLVAVGRLVRWQGDPATRAIRVWIYVSEGAESTWLKVLDGTLRGVSIGADPKDWETGEDGIRTCVRYDLVELSLVDQPSNPDALVLSVRVWGADEMGVAQVQRTANQPGDPPNGETAQAESDAAQVRPGQDAWHEIRDTSLAHARAAMTSCGCDECGDMADQLDARHPKMTRGRQSATAAMLAEVRRSMATQQAALLHAFDAKLAAALAPIDARLAIIEAQPAVDVPAVQRAGVLPAGVQHADLSRHQQAVPVAEQIRALQAAARATSDVNAQTAIAAQIFELQQASR